MGINYSISDAEMEALLRLDLSTFIARCFMELNPTTPYLHNWHIDLIADKLTQVSLGKIKRLIINIPPRYMKSISASIAFPAWVLGHDPSTRLICGSYGVDLANKFALDTRLIMQSDWYQATFPGTRFFPGKTATHDFETTARGGRMAVSTGSGITGRGADILILDDPQKPDDAQSELLRKGVNEWFEGNAYSRLNSKRDSAIIIVMQRLHLDDLVGHVLQKEGWEVVMLPAIAEEDERHAYNSIHGPQLKLRRAGEALHPSREPMDILADIRANLGEYKFAGQYQQSPVPLGGGMIRTDWLQYVEEQAFPTSFDMVIQSWDTASKDNQFCDYSVCTTWGMKNRKLYLLNVYRKRLDYPALKRSASELLRCYQPHAILVEDKSSGMQLIQELKQAGIHSVRACKPQGDKQTRLFVQAALFESGIIHLPQRAPWLHDYVHELTAFPTCKFDDQVDSTTQALAYLRQQLEEPGLIAYYRMESEKLRGLQSASG